MTLDSAMPLTSGMMALAFVQQSLEHLRPAARLRERLLFAPRLILSLPCWPPVWAWQCRDFALDPDTSAGAEPPLHPAIFNGPYNGGADRMSLLILFCLCCAYNLPERAGRWLGYLGMQFC
ncbi:MAG: hypothetical protein QM690_07595 [Sphingobium sp.]